MAYGLGRLYLEQGKLAEGETLLVRALKGYEQAFGGRLSSHRPALRTMHNLGRLYQMTNRPDMAKMMYTEALSGYTSDRGPTSSRSRELETLLEGLTVNPTQSEVTDDDTIVGGDMKVDIHLEEPHY